MNDNKQLLNLGACELAEAIKDKKVSPIEVAKAYLSHIERINPSFQALQCVFDEDFLKKAKDIQDNFNKYRDLPLCGVPVSLDQSFFISGKDRTLGSEVYKDKSHTKDDRYVQTIKEAGGNIIGTSFMPEFGMASWVSSETGSYQHPWYTEATNARFPGDGEVVSLRMAPLALTKDKGGASIVSSATAGISTLLRKDLRLVEEHLDLGVSVGELHEKFIRLGVAAREFKDLALGYQLLFGESKLVCKQNCFGKKKLKIGYRGAIEEMFPYADPDRQVCSLFNELRQEGHQLEELSLDFDSTFYLHFSNVFACDHYYPIVSRLETLSCNNSQQLADCTVDWLNYAQHVSGVAYSVSNHYLRSTKAITNALLELYDIIVIPSLPFYPERMPVFQPLRGLPSSIVSHASLWANALIFMLSDAFVLTVPVICSGGDLYTSMQVIVKESNLHLLGDFYHDLYAKGLIFDHAPACIS